MSDTNSGLKAIKSLCCTLVKLNVTKQTIDDLMDHWPSSQEVHYMIYKRRIKLRARTKIQRQTIS